MQAIYGMAMDPFPSRSPRSAINAAMTRALSKTRSRSPGPADPVATDSNGASGAAGFTLLELLVVIVILGLLIGLVAPAALRQLAGAKNSIARQSIEQLSSVLDLYRLDTGNYPSTKRGLQALVEQPSGVANWNGPYVKGGKVPLDPWNDPYVYRMPSTRGGHEYDLCSGGPSRQGDTSGQAGMICTP